MTADEVPVGPVGVPLMTPVTGFSVSPAGKLPLSRLKLGARGLPDARNARETGWRG